MEHLNLDTLPRTRKEAQALGSKYYFTGKPCKHGHADRRRTKDGNCFGCDQVKCQDSLQSRHKAGLKPTPRADAKAAGLKHYEGWCGKCGATVKKLVSSRACVSCSNEKVKEAFKTEVGRRYRKTADANRMSVPSQRIGRALRSRIRVAMLHQGLRKERGTTKALTGLGCLELQRYLEAQFQPGMSWDNYALDGWHIDHIIPCASFDLTDPEQQKACFHYSNLQPLWAVENMKKGARLVA